MGIIGIVIVVSVNFAREERELAAATKWTRDALAVQERAESREVQQAFEKTVASHLEWPVLVRSAILAHQVALGMTTEQVLLSWGNPNDVNRSVGSWGVHEQWVYGYSSRTYLYFENGILTSWSD